MDTMIQRKGFVEDNARFFIWSVWNFFKQTCDEEAEIGAPYLFEDFEHSDYTGVIAVSGSEKGAVYWTMSEGLLSTVLNTQFSDIYQEGGESQNAEALRQDYAGEMANIVAGNVRNYLGEHFLISTPVVIKSPGEPVMLPDNTTGLVLPITWKEFKCHLILGI
ncbi:chemotaxis protein CheX [Rubritalea spongiae]|uniref:Chemotaxis protein CheX n=1 Tax=Rubritalea spongiae TaxID=430797 RepID=A0ABW5DZL0_9BACT